MIADFPKALGHLENLGSFSPETPSPSRVPPTGMVLYMAPRGLRVIGSSFRPSETVQAGSTIEVQGSTRHLGKMVSLNPYCDLQRSSLSLFSFGQ